jgi:hypothetical protein
MKFGKILIAVLALILVPVLYAADAPAKPEAPKAAPEAKPADAPKDAAPAGKPCDKPCDKPCPKGEMKDECCKGGMMDCDKITDEVAASNKKLDELLAAVKADKGAKKNETLVKLVEQLVEETKGTNEFLAHAAKMMQIQRMYMMKAFMCEPGACPKDGAEGAPACHPSKDAPKDAPKGECPMNKKSDVPAEKSKDAKEMKDAGKPADPKAPTK